MKQDDIGAKNGARIIHFAYKIKSNTSQHNFAGVTKPLHMQDVATNLIYKIINTF